MKPVLLRPAAAADLDSAFLWYERRRSGLGHEFLSAVEAAMQEIAQDPVQFPVIHRDTRRALLSRFPYGVYYRVYDDVILLVACMHGRRDPERWHHRR